MRGKDKESIQESGFNDTPRKNNFYALRSSGEQETSPDMVTSMLKVFTVNVYALIDPGDKLSFVTPLIAKQFDILPNISNERFMVSTLVGESVVSRRVYRNCPIMLSNRVTYVELVELDMFHFDVILGTDLFLACFASIDYRTRVVKFNIPMRPF